MNLLQAFISIIDLWRPAFCKLEAFHRAREHAVAALCSFGHHTITSIAIFLGRDRKKPSADYKLYSWCKWKVEEIFNPLLKICLRFFEEDYIVIGVDDTKLKKTGKKIPFTSWQRDPMSPPYVRGGKRHYREPGYLLSTDIESSCEFLLQSYLDRVQIEYNHRDEKSILGVGEAQVRNERSVSHQPALCVAAYSALLLASILTYEDQPHSDFGEEPLWRPIPKRNSCRALVGQLRAPLIEQPQTILEMGIPPPIIAAILRKAD